MRQILPEVEQGLRVLLGAIKRNKQILLCGNGGSAADCQHFAAELSVRYRKDRRPLRAVTLTTDTSVLTAIGNDYGFEKLFERQVEALGYPGDVLVAFSTSGASANIRAAVDRARAKKLKVIVMTGAKGQALAKKADVAIVAPSAETARIQEIHGLVYHAWCECIDSSL